MTVHLFSLLRAFLSAHDYYTQTHLLSGERDTYFSFFVSFSLSLSVSLFLTPALCLLAMSLVLRYGCCCRVYMMLFVVESQPNQHNSSVFCLLILGRLHET